MHVELVGRIVLYHSSSFDPTVVLISLQGFVLQARFKNPPSDVALDVKFFGRVDDAFLIVCHGCVICKDLL